MNKTLASTHLRNLRRAWDGANLCRTRLQEAEDNAPILAGIIKDMRGHAGHDVDYYAWECVRIMKIAEKVIKAGLRGHAAVQSACDDIDAEAPALKDFRDSVTHVEDNRHADDVSYSGAAVRWLPGGRVEYLVDPRYEHHDYMGKLVKATETSLLTLADEVRLP